MSGPEPVEGVHPNLHSLFSFAIDLSVSKK
jgi:hypothetical protein